MRTVFEGMAKPMPTCRPRANDRGVDANHLALEVEERPAGVAFVDRRVRLDELVVRAVADTAAERRNDSAVTVPPRPNGLPMATTHSPGCASLELPSWTKGNGWPASTLITAMSVRGSVPMTCAGRLVPSSSVTVRDFSSFTTWLLVTMIPEALMMKPEPRASTASGCWGCIPREGKEARRRALHVGRVGLEVVRDRHHRPASPGPPGERSSAALPRHRWPSPPSLPLWPG